jgi:hypothetical protein
VVSVQHATMVLMTDTHWSAHECSRRPVQGDISHWKAVQEQDHPW